ncbi:xanthine dehydrogenase family protein molybdopterin-binding subunit [Muricoccus aerilatus]|uniref:xanthine dehydrogenase family protein molybdopterin-binding subunit n=1 Tax=Muricoccus aerilatus TaxID=452982 RepID=UPI0005C1DB86|nr:xanthine dehydrogenase family protein molybdopterin-binding subunit [Roseomonas aerilata]
MNETLPDDGWIGRSLPRAATRRLVEGRGRYLDDHAAKGELHAAFLRSPFPHAAFRISDREAARTLPGVRAVLTAEDLVPACRSWRTQSLAFAGLVSPVQGPLARERAVYQGEPVALVLAASRAIAEDALELIGIDWDELPAATDPVAALEPDAPAVHQGLPSNLAWRTEFGGGDVEAAFARAALVVEDRLVFTRHTGVPLESRGALASYDPAAEALEVRLSHQIPHQMQVHLAELLDLPMGRVRVIAGDVGGGFGIKMHVYPDEVAICAASRLLRRPVRWVSDRIEALMADIHAREHVMRARMAVDAEGRILAFDVDDIQGLGAYSVYPRSSTVEAISALRTVGAPYRFDAYRARLRSVLQNKVPTGQYRSVGHPIGCATTERLVDLAAAARGEDPLEFRRRNLLREAELPWTNPAGGRMAELSHTATLAEFERLLDLPSLRAEIAAMRAQGRLVGLGFAAVVEYTASGPGAYGPAGIPVSAVDTVVVQLEPGGDVIARASVAEIGQGIQQGIVQVVADAVGVSPSRITIHTGDTGNAPHGGGAWASRGAGIGGEAAWGAGRKLRAEILGAAASLLQTTPEALDLRDGQVVDATGTPRLALADLAATVFFRGHELPGGLQPQFTATHQFRREEDVFLTTNGLQASLVEVDPDTGLVTPLRHWVVGDCGRRLNPLLVDEQVRGGVVQGIGEALLEACRYDPGNGQLLTGTLADYLLPMADNAPDITVGHVETPYSGSALGAKGAGEAGTCGAPAAVLCAVNDALAARGAAVTEMPITPAVVLRALGTLP